MAKEYKVLSDWEHMIENLTESPTNFYNLVESAIVQRKVPDIRISRTTMKESGIFSAEREYLTVVWKRYTHDICAFPYGNSFYISSRLSFSESFFQRILGYVALAPIIGATIAPTLGNTTFYQQDTTIASHSLIHSALLSVIDEITKTKGLKALSESERKPIMTDFFKPKTLKR